jgi:hypothetical protein
MGRFDCKVHWVIYILPLNLEPFDQPLFRHALKHSSASIMLSSREFFPGVMSFLALLKARSHSRDVAGRANISRAQCHECQDLYSTAEVRRTPAEQTAPLWRDSTAALLLLVGHS